MCIRDRRWTIRYGSLTFNIKPMNFKHTGLFPEQAANWDFAQEQILSLIHIYFPEPVPASAQDWSPADPSSFDAARQALLTAVRGEDASERSVLSLLSRMTDRFNELLTEYYFCSLDYMRSPTSCTQEYVRYSSVCGQAESDYLSAVQEMCIRDRRTSIWM